MTEVTYNVKELLAHMDGKIDGIIVALQTKASAEVVSGHEKRIADLESGRTIDPLRRQLMGEFRDYQTKLDIIEAEGSPDAKLALKETRENHNHIDTLRRQMAYYAGGITAVGLLFNLGLARHWF